MNWPGINWRRWLNLGRKVAPIIEAAVNGATSLQDARRRLARRAMAGDLDDAITITDSTLELVTDYVDNG